MTVKKVDNISKVKARLSRMRGARVGYLAESTGGQTYDNGLTLAHNALIHEKGSPANNIPPRPFMTQGSDDVFDSPDEIGDALLAVVEGKQGPKSGSQRVGSVFVKSIQNAIIRGRFEALKPETASRKGSSAPLQETGRLKQALDSRAK